ncbi:3-dehydroquinate synthase [mine drainage metagenome]|uniref:3-dehydroquinate synthase n=1 Tax=mine drainage metagenome TaxID=410659 RepID=A0A1J5Q9Y8_9ZZZZ
MTSRISRINVAATDPYEVTIGRGVINEIRPLLVGIGRIALVVPEVLLPLAEDLIELVRDIGAEVTLIPTRSGEAQKQIDSVVTAWNELATAGFTRSDLIIGIGGGATTDLAGFIAATWLRGVRWIAVPTTLAGMVDAAVGGKTGINLEAGKNLVGAFHSPTAVFCDTDFLSSLDERDISAGLAEVVKCGFISDPRILDLIENDPAAAQVWDGEILFELIERAVTVKAQVVATDFKESSLREILNYGHTLAHAIELNEKYQWRHGEAVSVGLVYAAVLANFAGRLDAAIVDRHKKILSDLGLPISYEKSAWPALLDTMYLDKKTRAKKLRFVILEGLATPVRLEDPELALLVRAYEEVTK